MNRMFGAIVFGMLSGSLAVMYLGLVIATPHIPEQVKALQATLVSEVSQNLAAQPAAQPTPLYVNGVQEVAAVPVSSAGSAVNAPADDGSCALRSSYPGSVRQWCATIQSEASQHNLDPNLVAAVMQQESGGNPGAYSGSGAVGLLQVMPSDGLAASFYCVAGPCFAGRPSSQQLLDPQFNIAYGVKMLAGLVARYQNVRDALVAYGPANVGYSYADTVLAIYNRP
jgi:soluble lytic murein transglycosylase-like protein